MQALAKRVAARSAGAAIESVVAENLNIARGPRNQPKRKNRRK